MDEKEFQELELLITDKMDELDALQEVYRRESGQRFVRGLRLNYVDNPLFERETTNRPVWARYGGD
jgi:hypothetical protein